MEFKEFLLDTTRAAGKITLKMFNNHGSVQIKSGLLDLVTDGDKASNELFVNKIKKYFPDHGIISEEMGYDNTESEYVWIIDPLDGTLNYATGIPCYAVIAALRYRGQTILGAVYDPIRDEMFFAERGKGAYIMTPTKRKIGTLVKIEYSHGRVISCAKHKTLKNSIGITNDSISFLRRDFYDKVLEQTAEKAVWASSLGSTGISCNYMADGRKHWYLCSGGGGIWDYAAPVLLLKESGCLVTDLKGEPWKAGTGPFIAANPKLHKELISITQKL